MDNILPDNEYQEIEGRAYINPQVSLDESNAFIDNLRSVQGQQNQEIFSDTQMLGTDIPSIMGGLTGGNSYFTSRYQTPQTNSAVANLRAAAQAQALNEVLANEQAIWKNRYQNAYRNYQKRNYNRSKSPYSSGGSGTTPQTPTTSTDGGIEYEDTTSSTSFDYSNSVKGLNGYYTVIGPDGIAHAVDMKTGEEIILTPDSNKKTSGGSNGSGMSGGGGGGGGAGGR